MVYFVRFNRRGVDSDTLAKTAAVAATVRLDDVVGDVNTCGRPVSDDVDISGCLPVKQRTDTEAFRTTFDVYIS